jgi:hypothetical protein
MIRLKAAEVKSKRIERIKNRWKRYFIDFQGISIRAMSRYEPSTIFISQKDFLTDSND